MGNKVAPCSAMNCQTWDTRWETGGCVIRQPSLPARPPSASAPVRVPRPRSPRSPGQLILHLAGTFKLLGYPFTGGAAERLSWGCSLPYTPSQWNGESQNGISGPKKSCQYLDIYGFHLTTTNQITSTIKSIDTLTSTNLLSLR